MGSITITMITIARLLKILDYNQNTITLSKCN